MKIAMIASLAAVALLFANVSADAKRFYRGYYSHYSYYGYGPYYRYYSGLPDKSSREALDTCAYC